MPTFFVFGSALRSRGAQFGGLSIRAGDMSSATGIYLSEFIQAGLDRAAVAAVWSMPGGFSSGSRDGYQNVDEERGQETPTPKQPLSEPPVASAAVTNNSNQVPPAVLGPYQSG